MEKSRRRTRRRPRRTLRHGRRRTGARRPPAWKGWRAPGYRGRREMYRVCGRECFLEPPYKYPICSKTCKIDKRGVMSAYIRARQYHNETVAKRAMRLRRSRRK